MRAFLEDGALAAKFNCAKLSKKIKKQAKNINDNLAIIATCGITLQVYD